MVATATISWVSGSWVQRWDVAFTIGAAGTALTALCTVPPWPHYRTRPIAWLPLPEKRGHGARKNKSDGSGEGRLLARPGSDTDETVEAVARATVEGDALMQPRDEGGAPARESGMATMVD